MSLSTDKIDKEGKVRSCLQDKQSAMEMFEENLEVNHYSLKLTGAEITLPLIRDKTS